MSFVADPLYISAVSIAGARSLFHLVQSNGAGGNLQFANAIYGGLWDMAFIHANFGLTEKAKNPTLPGDNETKALQGLTRMVLTLSPFFYVPPRVFMDLNYNPANVFDTANGHRIAVGIDLSSSAAITSLVATNIATKTLAK